MGKNKDRLLTKSIPWADSILEQVINLPAAGGEDLQSTAEAQVLAVENLLKMVNRKVAENRGEGKYVWKKLTAEGGEFVDFVVSSDAETYPNGGMQEGYWYELVEEGIDFSKTAIKKIAVDNFTLTTDTAGSSGIRINHSLGELPRAAVIIGEITKCANTNSNYFNVHTCVMINLSNKHGAQVAIGYNYQNTEKRVALVSDSAWSNPSETQVQYYDGSSYTILPAGIEFTLITMA